MGVFIITDHKATLSGQKSLVPTELLCGVQMGGMKIGPSEKKNNTDKGSCAFDRIVWEQKTKSV